MKIIQGAEHADSILANEQGIVTERDKLTIEKQTLETNCLLLIAEGDRLLAEKESALSKQASSEEHFQLGEGVHLRRAVDNLMHIYKVHRMK